MLSAFVLLLSPLLCKHPVVAVASSSSLPPFPLAESVHLSQSSFKVIVKAAGDENSHRTGPSQEPTSNQRNLPTVWIRTSVEKITHLSLKNRPRSLKMDCRRYNAADLYRMFESSVVKGGEGGGGGKGLFNSTSGPLTTTGEGGGHGEGGEPLDFQVDWFCWFVEGVLILVVSAVVLLGLTQLDRQERWSFVRRRNVIMGHFFHGYFQVSFCPSSNLRNQIPS